jgi:hypothetical protein
MSNPESILDSVKKALGIDSEDTAFDIDVVMHVNSTFGVLKQLGVGPAEGFSISDNTTLWSDYSTELAMIGMVRSYLYVKVRLLFDPPATSFGLDAIQQQIRELEWRLNIQAETDLIEAGS